MKNITIKFKLMSVAIIIGIILIVIGVFSFFKLKEIQHIHKLSDHSAEIEQLGLKMRKAEKDFMLRSVKDDMYYQTKSSKYLSKFDDLLKEVHSEIEILLADDFIKEMRLQTELSNLKTYFDNYDSGFKVLINTLTKRGYNNNGEIGEFRKTIHGINEHINEIDYLAAILLKIRKDEKDYLLRQDLKYQKKLKRNVEKLKKRISTDNQIDNDTKAELIDELDIYYEAFSQVVELDKKIGYSANEGLQKEFRAAIHQVEPAIHNLAIFFTSESEKQIENSIYSIASLILSFIIFSSIYMFFIITSIKKSLTDAQRTVKAIAQGNFSEDIEIKQFDEIGELQKDIVLMLKKLRFSVSVAKSVSKGDLRVLENSELKDFGGELDDALKLMINKLQMILSNVNISADNLVSAANQVSSASQTVAQGSNEQAASAEEISGTVEEIVSTINQNSDNALQTEKISNETLVNIEAGNKSFIETNNSVIEIAEKILIVNDIAEKIDLLALNAAVEAARAGEYGKGFAVVASEIRKLAENSQKSASIIDTLSKSTINLSQNSIKLLGGILPNAKKTTLLVNEISASSIEQNAGANQINNAIQQLSLVIQQNSATSEEMSSSAQELASQAEMLKENISFFKLSTDDFMISSTNHASEQKEKIEVNNSKGIEINLNENHDDNDFENF